jgi:SulP family sulfate permease
VLIFAPLAQYVPKAALAALLLLTAIRLFEPKRISYAFRASALDAVVLTATAAVGLLIGLDEAILIGVGLSIVLFVPRAAKLKCSELVVDRDAVVRERVSSDQECKTLLLYDLEGELFFGAAPDLEHHLSKLRGRALAENIEYIVLRVKRVRNPDLVCLEQLEHFLKSSEKMGVVVLLAGIRSDLFEAMQRLGFDEWYSRERLFPQGSDEDSATLAAIRSVYKDVNEENDCDHCSTRRNLPGRERVLYYQV